MRRRSMIEVENGDACTGCLICEMACSFHHSLIFSRSQSSIRVNKSLSNPERGAQINISYGTEVGIPVCDLCEGEEYPLCIGLCPQNVYRLKGRES
jgi:Fe-S-cluster-containing hydrogenase component 2